MELGTWNVELELRWNPRVVAVGRVAEVEAELARMGIDPVAEDFAVAAAGAGLTVALENLTEVEAGLLARCWGTDGFWEGSRRGNSNDELRMSNSGPSDPAFNIRNSSLSAVLLRSSRGEWERRLSELAGLGPEGAAAARGLGEAIARFDRREFRIPLGGTSPSRGPEAPPTSRWLELGRRTAILGILNVTPDSFSDGDAKGTAEGAVAKGLALREAGADVIDVGGESTRPGSDPVPVEEELRRVIPVVRELAGRHGLPVSIDTSKARVAREAVAAGACWVNDVTALAGDPEMAGVVAAAKVPVILMHMRGTPKSMQEDPRYVHLTAEILGDLRRSVARAVAAGIDRERILIDPGLGFGKRLEDNFEILRRLAEFRSLGLPVVVGPSRKRFTGWPSDLPVGERAEGTAAAVALAVQQGAAVVRVHDVRAAVRVARLAEAVRDGAGYV